MRKASNAKVTVKENTLYIKSVTGLEVVEMYSEGEEDRAPYIAYTCYTGEHRNWVINFNNANVNAINACKSINTAVAFCTELEEKPLRYKWECLRSKKNMLKYLKVLEENV